MAVVDIRYTMYDLRLLDEFVEVVHSFEKLVVEGGEEFGFLTFAGSDFEEGSAVLSEVDFEDVFEVFGYVFEVGSPVIEDSFGVQCIKKFG
jgi:hypothetical protein